MTKEFKKEGVLRILLGVPKEVAIGAIIESELFKKSDLEVLVDQIVDLLPIPDIVFDILPELLVDLKLFIVALVWKWLNLLPGDPFEFDIPEFFEEVPLLDETPGIYDGEKLVTQEDYNTLLDNYNTLLDNYNTLLDNYNTLKKRRSGFRNDLMDFLADSVRFQKKLESDNAYDTGLIEGKIFAYDNTASWAWNY